jgi:hypothetical protein
MISLGSEIIIALGMTDAAIVGICRLSVNAKQSPPGSDQMVLRPATR